MADEERWERRLTPLVVAAAAAVLPLLALSLAHPHGLLEEVETIGHWVVWLVFAAEAAIMLAVESASARAPSSRSRPPG